MSKTVILSTKTLSDIQRRELLSAGFEVFEEDFISTKKQEFELNAINDNLIFTSQNAAQSILENSDFDNLKTKNVFCVGLKTKFYYPKLGSMWLPTRVMLPI